MFDKLKTILLLLLAALIASAVHATQSDRLVSYATIESGDSTYRAVVTKRGQELFRARISDAQDSSRIYILFREQELSVYNERGVEIKMADAQITYAEYLFDIVALNPSFHFDQVTSDNFDLRTPVFQDFTIELKLSEEPIPGTNIHQPQHMRLLYDEDGKSRLLRKIDYLSFFEDTETLQPNFLLFSDENTGSKGRIEIHKVDYDPGLPEFLFEIDESKGASETPQTTVSGLDSITESVFIWPASDQDR